MQIYSLFIFNLSVNFEASDYEQPNIFFSTCSSSKILDENTNNDPEENNIGLDRNRHRSLGSFKRDDFERNTYGLTL